VTALWVSLAVIGAGLGWLGHSWWWPFQRCPACMGRGGRGALSTPRAFNRCRRCKGTGERVRIGARAISKATGHPVRGARK
jgi:hypothetical protein